MFLFVYSHFSLPSHVCFVCVYTAPHTFPRCFCLYVCMSWLSFLRLNLCIHISAYMLAFFVCTYVNTHWLFFPMLFCYVYSHLAIPMCLCDQPKCLFNNTKSMHVQLYCMVDNPTKPPEIENRNTNLIIHCPFWYNVARIVISLSFCIYLCPNIYIYIYIYIYIMLFVVQR